MVYSGAIRLNALKTQAASNPCFSPSNSLFNSAAEDDGGFCAPSPTSSRT
jgi:hypothetical protein